MKRPLLAFAVLSILGCSSSIPFEELPAETAAVTCELLFDCCEPGQRQGFTDMSTCVTERTMEGAGSSQLLESVRAGRIAYDGAAAADCLGLAMCTVEGLDLDACNRVYTGVVPAGGACTFGLDCADGPQACVEEVCVAPAALGAPCTGPCVDGAICSARTLVCERIPSVGEPCPSFFCGEDSFCNSMTQICEARRAIGEACDNLGQCESFTCEGGVCVERNTAICGEG